MLELSVLVVLWALLIRLIQYSRTLDPIQNFNPYEILELSPFATTQQIRRAYRSLSLKHHPDKARSDPAAAAKFILITKAYQALTDEIAKANFAKYGNPDGPTAMKIGIGLPKLLIHPENQLLILVLFVLIVIVIIPSVFLVYFYKQQKYTVHGVLVESVQVFIHFLNENSRLRQISELLAASGESRTLTFLRPSDNIEMQPLLAELGDIGKQRFPGIPLIARNTRLLQAHMERLHSKMSPLLLADLNKILQVAPRITQVMLEIALSHGWMLTVQSIVDFRRCLFQALPLRCPSPLGQLPHFDSDTTRVPARGRNTVRSLRELAELSRDERARLLSATLTQAQLGDVNTFCEALPLMDINVAAFVEGEQVVVSGDIVSVAVTLTRRGGDNDSSANLIGAVHAPWFPEVKMEDWWLLLYRKSESSFLATRRCQLRDRQVKEVLKFPLGEDVHGKFSIQLIAMCDTYFGFDVTKEIHLQVLSPETARRQIVQHPDDIALDNAPTLLQQILGDGDQEGDDVSSISSGDDSFELSASSAESSRAPARHRGPPQQKSNTTKINKAECETTTSCRQSAGARPRIASISSGSPTRDTVSSNGGIDAIQ